jgi:hypothetical protein
VFDVFDRYLCRLVKKKEVTIGAVISALWNNSSMLAIKRVLFFLIAYFTIVFIVYLDNGAGGNIFNAIYITALIVIAIVVSVVIIILIQEAIEKIKNIQIAKCPINDEKEVEDVR